jgi:general secretion pathway protein D
MKRFFPIVVLMLAVAVAIPAMAESAGSLWKKGHDAEMRQDYEAAYNFYKQAFDQKPKDIRYRTSYERGKFLAAASHVHKGQALRDEGKLQEALAEFDTAVKIDGSSFIAQQELRRTREMSERANNPDAQPPAAPQISPIVTRLANSGGPVELTPISDTPITLNVTEDTKVIYETVGKLAGINVLFDPDYTSRRIHIALNGVTLQDALALISMESKTFWRAVTTNTIFIAADTPAKRKELEQNVLKTFYLTNISSPTELQDLVNTLRTVLEIRLMTPLPTQNAVVIRATPDQVALAEKLINDLDKARPEVVVEVAVLQVTRERLRNLGIQPPTSAVVQLNSNINTTTNANGQTTNAGNTASNGSVNLNHLGNLTAKDFTVTIPQATVNALYSDSNTKLIQNPQIRALDGQKASLKIGDRVPVATGSFGAGLGGVGLNSLVNTQFNYIDVGVNVDITPVVHGTKEVTLKVMLDVSNVTNQVNIGGINQPQIGQRKIEHQIRLREGEVNILGGIFEDSDIKSISGLPFLSQVPLLKYLFSSTNTDKRENEIVFVMIPHIVRSQDLSPLNMRALEIGTGNNIDIRRAAGSAPAQAAPATTPRGGAAAAQPGTPAAPAPGTNPATAQQPPAAGAATVAFDPQIINQTVGQTFAVDITMTGENIYSVPLQIGYDPKTLQLLNVSNGTFLSKDGQIVSLTRRDDPSTGSVTITASRPPNASGISGQGSVFTLTFMAKSAGESSLVITKAGVRDAGMQAVNVTGSQAHVNIK